MRWLALVASLMVGTTMADEDPCSPRAINASISSYEHRDDVKAEVVSGQLLVRFRTGVPPEQAEEVVRSALGFLPASEVLPSGTRLYAIGGRDPVSAAEDVTSTPGASESIEFAEPNYVIRAFAISDPLAKCQCALGVLQAEQAWIDFKPASGDIVVAVVDSGVDATHPDLKGPVLSTTNTDDCGHGTHLSGIIAAVANNRGVIGAAGPVHPIKILPIRFMDRFCLGNSKDAAIAVQAAVDANVAVILCSWGTTKGSKELRLSFANAEANEIVVVAAAGNARDDNDRVPSFPANYPFANIISVMATRCDDTLTRFSNFGKTTVDLAAPGDAKIGGYGILSTARNHGYGYDVGTSMAAAFVAAGAAMVKAQDHSLKPAAIRMNLMDTADCLPVLKKKCVSKARLNLANAVTGKPGCKPLRTRVLEWFIRVFS